MLWIFLFIPRFCIQLFKKKKYKSNSKNVSSSVNNVTYRTIFVCHDCGKSWEAD